MPELLLLDHPQGKVLAVRKDDGEVVERKAKGGDPYVIPPWCSMPPDDHACAWGCMSILQGCVKQYGRANCKVCECYTPEDGEIFVVKSGVLTSEEDFRLYVMGLPTSEGFGYPMRYPAVAVLLHHQIKDEHGRNVFATKTVIVYPDDFKPPAAAVAGEAQTQTVDP